jgi:hypothetical protein
VKGSWPTTRVQRKYQLFPIGWRTVKIATTDSNHNHRIYPNLLAEKILTGINQAWVADITYIRILKGFVFLAAILDRYSRKIIGWAISQRIDAELCVAVLRIALEQRLPHRAAFTIPIAACSMPALSTSPCLNEPRCKSACRGPPIPMTTLTWNLSSKL